MMRLLAGAALSALIATPSFAMELTSPDVTDGQSFNAKFVCTKYGGQSVSPALAWTGAPPETKSIAVTMFDPDAGTAGFWHWLAADIPAGTTGLAQGAGAAGALPTDSTPLPNGAKHANYDGPCPPAGAPHHYQITVYAMPDEKSAIPAGSSAADAGKWLADHALATARITPVYAKPN